jgi:hypothetical protein
MGSPLPFSVNQSAMEGQAHQKPKDAPSDAKAIATISAYRGYTVGAMLRFAVTGTAGA